MSERAVPSVRQAFGARLRALRTDKGLSQEKPGEAAGLSGKFIGEVERGEKSISLDSLHHVALALGQPLAVLVAITPTKPNVNAERIYALAMQQKPKTLAKMLAVVRELVA